MPILSAIDDSFDSRNSSVCQLSIQYGAQLFSYAILDLLSNRFVALRHWWFTSPVGPDKQADHLRILMSSEGYLIKPYDRIHFMYLSPISVLIPDQLFKEGAESSYFTHHNKVPEDHAIMQTPIEEIASRVLFPIPTTVSHYLTSHFDRVSFHHQSCPLIRSGNDWAGDPSGASRAVLFAGPGFIDLALFSGKNLILYNTYPAGTTGEAVYHVLYLYNQFGLIHEEVPLEICGFIENFPGAANLLGSFIRHISYSRLSPGFRYSPAFTTLAPHHFNLLLNLPQCV